MPTPGSRLADRYRLEIRLGAGGMGEVWRATDEALHRTVAVKLMHPALLDEPGFSYRFQAEARAMASVDHPGVVRVHDFQSAGSNAFLVMEYVEGETLASRLRRAGRLPVAETVGLLAQAADALQAVHDRGIIHRDIKPTNLLVRPDGRLVLTDFGIARAPAATALTATGAVLGTLPYLAPEQVLGHPATDRSDIYALGLVGYECLTGQSPFARDNPFASAMARVQEAPATLPAELPQAVVMLLYRALATDPEQRWPSAQELAAACRTAAATAEAAPGPPVPAPLPAPSPAPPSWPGSPPGPAVPNRPARRLRAVGAGLVGTILVALAAVVWVVANGDDSPEARPEPPAQASTPTGLPSEASGAPAECTWLAAEPSGVANLYQIDVGTPPPGPAPRGSAAMTLATNRGVIEVTLYAEAAPCTYLSLRHLAAQGFYEDTACHRLTDELIYILQCGDPSGSGGGGPAYWYAEENLPTTAEANYPRGTLAMARGAAPSTTGSQFFLVYEDTTLLPDYTIAGLITQGMDIVEDIVAGGHDASYSLGDGVPNEELVIESLRIE